MLSPSEPLAREFVIFTLVLARLASMIMIAPFFGSSAVPWRGRAVLAFTLAMLIVPLESIKATPMPAATGDYLVRLGAEILIGLVLGLGLMLLFAGIQVAGGMISQASGLQLGEIFDPTFHTSMPAFSQLLTYVTLAVFVAIGGHRTVMEAVLDTFVWMPAGQGACLNGATEAVTSLVMQSLVLGIRTAAPAILALLLSTIMLGLLSRGLPQLSAAAMGVGLNVFVALGMVGVSLGAAAWAFEEQLFRFLDTLRELAHSV